MLADGAEAQAAGAEGGVLALEHRALLVEAVVRGGQAVEVGAEAAGVEVLRHVAHHLRVAQEGEGKLAFRGLGHGDDGARRRVRRGIECLAEDARDARVRVLEVRAGVALEAHHAVEVEDVVARDVRAEVGVLHRGDAHGAADGGEVRVGHAGGGRVRVRAACAHLAGAALDGLVEERLQREVLAAARLEGLLVGAEHAAEGDMDELGLGAVRQRGPADHAHRVEDVLEVVALAGVHHVDHAVALEVLHAETACGEVGGGIEEAAVALADQHGALAVRVAHHDGAVVLGAQAGLHERLHRGAELLAEEALAAAVLVGEVDAQRVGGLEDLAHGAVDDLLPLGHQLRVA